MRKRARAHANLVMYRKAVRGLKRTVQSAHDKNESSYAQHEKVLRFMQQNVVRLKRELGGIV